MIIPSKDLMNILVGSDGGIFFEKVRKSNTPVIIVKAPAFAIKSIINGAKIKIIFSANKIDNKEIGCLGVYIEDDPDKPLNIFRALSHQDKKQLKLFKKAINIGENDIFFLDELCRPVISGKYEREDIAFNEIENIIELINSDLDNVNKEMQRKALDLFEEKIDNSFYGKNNKRKLWEINLNVSLGEANNLIHLETGKFLIDNLDEGGGLEQTAHQILHFMYEEDCYRSPRVGKGKNERELTDILALKDSHLCIIESKALSIIKNNKPKSTFRRVRNIKKDIKKGIKQIQGAVRKIRNGHKIYSNKGKLIKSKNDYKEIHGCILISEMHPDLDWEWVAERVYDVAKKKRILLHVLDLMELYKLLVVSQGVDVFRYNLYKRWETVFKNNNALVRSREKSI